MTTEFYMNPENKNVSIAIDVVKLEALTELVKFYRRCGCDFNRSQLVRYALAQTFGEKLNNPVEPEKLIGA